MNWQPAWIEKFAIDPGSTELQQLQVEMLLVL